MLLATLAGCGGGGSSTGSGSTPVVSPALSFTPDTVRASVNAGSALTLNVIAAVTRPAEVTGQVFASVVDSNGVLQPNPQLVRDSDSQYHAVLQTAPGLAVGTYTGNFSVRLCRDSACVSQFPGSPVSLPYSLQIVAAGQPTFTATPATALAGTFHVGGTAASPINVAINAAGRSWSVSSSASWLKPALTSGSGNATLAVSFDATGLTVGEYNANLTLSASDGQSVTLAATLSVQPSGLVSNSSSLTFNAINGAPIPAQNITIDTDDQASAKWTASASVGWLSVTPSSGSTPASMALSVDPRVGTLASGSYSNTLSLAAPGLSTRTLPVTLNLSPATLSTSVNAVTLGGTYGRDFSSTASVTLSLNTLSNSWPWILDTLPAWASASSTSGSVSQTGSKLSFTAVPNSATVGSSSRLINASASVNGDQVKAAILLTINKDRHTLIPSETAAALSSAPGWSRLTRTITVTDNFGNFGGMRASSSASWLAANVSSNQIALVADPSTLTADSLNLATVTITPTDTDAVAPEVIRIALWKGTRTPSSNTTTVLPYSNVITDPIRPYAYVHNGGTYIDVYHLYTGQKVASITGLASSLGDMTTSANGDLLYLLDLSNRALVSINLNTQKVTGNLALSAADRTTRLKILRPNGVEILALSTGAAYLTSDNTKLSLPLSSGTLAASGDGKRLLQQSEDSGAVQIATYSVDYAALNGGTLYPAKISAASHAGAGTQGQDIAVSLDGTRLYSASSATKSCSILNPADLGVLAYLAAGDGAPNNVEVGSDGRLYCGTAANGAVSDIWLYSSSGTLLNQFKLTSTGKQLAPRQMAVSGDGLTLIAITTDGTTTIVPVGP
ncbi:quinoprotein amine dehydrogenase [Pseudoduganella danionis]|uniref:Quinoprotein amine dehydrogenase n=1 Tax=Pseudoduganella danionis TaxID=1890295 RepID=A0ABW9SHU2_9BURK|nr:quinoprotein amine dehydrogenase [Pseudoduganella danionis]